MSHLRITGMALVAIALLLPGCGPQRNNDSKSLRTSVRPEREPFDIAQDKLRERIEGYATHIEPREKHVTAFQETKNGITIKAEILNAQALKKIFGGKGQRLIQKGIVPLQVTLHNDGSEAVLFDPTKSTVSFANHRTVASILERTNAGNVVIWALGGVALAITGPMAVVDIGMFIWLGWSFYLLGTLPAVGVLILTPTCSMLYANKTTKANQQLNEKIAATQKTITIAPGQNITTILFLDGKSFDGTASLTVENKTHQTTVFDITLPQ